jgi:hypothetical protein
VQEALSVRAFADGGIGGPIADWSSLVGYRLLTKEVRFLAIEVDNQFG